MSLTEHLTPQDLTAARTEYRRVFDSQGIGMVYLASIHMTLLISCITVARDERVDITLLPTIDSSMMEFPKVDKELINALTQAMYQELTAPAETPDANP